MQETARLRFLRNHYENVRLMRIRQRKLESEGRYEDAQAVKEIADAWEGIGQVAEDQEAADAGE